MNFFIWFWTGLQEPPTYPQKNICGIASAEHSAIATTVSRDFEPFANMCWTGPRPLTTRRNRPLDYVSMPRRVRGYDVIIVAEQHILKYLCYPQILLVCGNKKTKEKNNTKTFKTFFLLDAVFLLSSSIIWASKLWNCCDLQIRT